MHKEAIFTPALTVAHAVAGGMPFGRPTAVPVAAKGSASHAKSCGGTTTGASTVYRAYVQQPSPQRLLTLYVLHTSACTSAPGLSAVATPPRLARGVACRATAWAAPKETQDASLLLGATLRQTKNRGMFESVKTLLKSYFPNISSLCVFLYGWRNGISPKCFSFEVLPVVQNVWAHCHCFVRGPTSWLLTAH